MPDSVDQTDPEKLDASQILQQAAALAAHLQRSGVAFIPQPNADNVADWKSRFDVSPPAEAAQRPEESEQTADGDGVTHASSSGNQSVTSRPPAASRPPAVRPANRVASVSAFTSAEGEYPGESLDRESRLTVLESLATEVAACTACQVLASCRTKTVFGEGDADARFVFFGEGPGGDEDRSGRPFVGRAGQLLTKMISACTLNRPDTYILNTVKCRPPGNRNPEPLEIENCRSFYQQQLQTIRPEYIVCLGAVAAQELLRTKLSVGRLRGKLHQYHTSKVLVTYHPAYLLRNPAAKKAAWEDLQLMLADAGIDV